MHIPIKFILVYIAINLIINITYEQEPEHISGLVYRSQTIFKTH